jgi:hypothetical protein
LVITHDPNGELTWEKSYQYLLEELFLSVKSWHDWLADALQSMNFYPCNAEPDVWMKDCDPHYEYLLVYVDELMFIGNNPQGFYDALINEHGFQFKGVG